MERMLSCLGIMALVCLLGACSATSGGTSGDGSSNAAAEAVQAAEPAIAINPSPDKYTWYVKSYVGMNASQVGYTALDGSRRETYGYCAMPIVFVSPDGTYIDPQNEELLQQYRVVGQNLAPNTEIKYTFITMSDGAESSSLIRRHSCRERPWLRAGRHKPGSSPPAQLDERHSEMLHREGRGPSGLLIPALGGCYSVIYAEGMLLGFAWGHAWPWRGHPTWHGQSDIPGRDGDDSFCDRIGAVCRADDAACTDFEISKLAERREVLCGLWAGCSSHLYLYGVKNPSILNDEVYLPLAGIPVEPDVSQVAARIHKGFQYLVYNEGLEEMPCHSSSRSGNRVCPAQKIAGKACVHEEELGGFRKALARIGPEGPNKMNDS